MPLHANYHAHPHLRSRVLVPRNRNRTRDRDRLQVILWGHCDHTRPTHQRAAGDPRWYVVRVHRLTIYVRTDRGATR